MAAIFLFLTNENLLLKFWGRDWVHRPETWLVGILNSCWRRWYWIFLQIQPLFADVLTSSKSRKILLSITLPHMRNVQAGEANTFHYTVVGRGKQEESTVFALLVLSPHKQLSSQECTVRHFDMRGICRRKLRRKWRTGKSDRMPPRTVTTSTYYKISKESWNYK